MVQVWEKFKKVRRVKSELEVKDLWSSLSKIAKRQVLYFIIYECVPPTKYEKIHMVGKVLNSYIQPRRNHIKWIFKK